jgi:hypothetical protein
MKCIQLYTTESFKYEKNAINASIKTKPWGQYTLFNAYLKNKENFKWGEIGQEWLTTNCLPEEPIWCGHRKNVLKYYDKNGNMTKKIRIGDRAGFRNMIFLPELARMKRNKK